MKRLLLFLLSTCCLVASVTAETTISTPPTRVEPFAAEPVTPAWLIEKTFDNDRSIVGVHDFKILDGSVFIHGTGNDQIRITGMTITNGEVIIAPDDFSRPGIYVGPGASSANTGMRFAICRQCQLADLPEVANQPLFQFDGIVFEKADFTLRDIMAIPTTLDLEQQQYVFSDETNNKVKPLAIGSIDYSNPRYLESLGYGDYLNLPVRTTLLEKAQAGDAKAQFIYALYWREIANFDPAGASIPRMQAIFNVAEANNIDAALWQGIFFKEQGQFEPAIPLFKRAMIDNRPYGYYKLAMMLSNGEGMEKDLKLACSMFEQAALVGFNFAQYDHGFCLYNGEGGTQDKDKGERYMALSAVNYVTYGQARYEQCGVPAPRIENDQLVYTPCPSL